MQLIPVLCTRAVGVQLVPTAEMLLVSSGTCAHFRDVLGAAIWAGVVPLAKPTSFFFRTLNGKTVCFLDNLPAVRSKGKKGPEHLENSHVRAFSIFSKIILKTVWKMSKG